MYARAKVAQQKQEEAQTAIQNANGIQNGKNRATIEKKLSRFNEVLIIAGPLEGGIKQKTGTGEIHYLKQGGKNNAGFKHCRKIQF